MTARAMKKAPTMATWMISAMNASQGGAAGLGLVTDRAQRRRPQRGHLDAAASCAGPESAWAGLLDRSCHRRGPPATTRCWCPSRTSRMAASARQLRLADWLIRQSVPHLSGQVRREWQRP